MTKVCWPTRSQSWTALLIVMNNDLRVIVDTSFTYICIYREEISQRSAVLNETNFNPWHWRSLYRNLGNRILIMVKLLLFERF